ncbi:histidine kinase [Plesiomonas shigelloides]|nr:histidine kinase [Plesiomonas shigelloides]
MINKLRLRYQTIEIGSHDMHLCTLRDKQQFSDPKDVALDLGISSATWPIFGVVWPSSLVLAHHMLDFDITGKRILEVGCGMAVTSHLLNKRHADITATDYHPEVQQFLDRNTQLNDGENIAFERLDWAGKIVIWDYSTLSLAATYFMKMSMWIYSQDLSKNMQISSVRSSLLILAVEEKSKFSKKMVEYGFGYDHIKPEHTEFLSKDFNGYILRYYRGFVDEVNNTINA